MLPLSTGDLNGDGALDYVLARSILVSSIGAAVDGGAASVTYVTAFTKEQGTWTQAAIADFTGDGKPDVVAGSPFELDLDFFNGTGTTQLNPFTVTTSGPVDHFSVADLDGDLIADLTLALGSALGAADQQLAIGVGLQRVSCSIRRSGSATSGASSRCARSPCRATRQAFSRSPFSSPGRRRSMVRLALLSGSGDRQLACRSR